MSMYARLKPFNGKVHLVRNYTVAGIRFNEANGWYIIDDDIAEYLRTVRQSETDPYSAPAFDVCSQEEAEDIDAQEMKVDPRKKAPQANDTRDWKNRAQDRANQRQRGDLRTGTDNMMGARRLSQGEYDRLPENFDDNDMNSGSGRARSAGSQGGKPMTEKEQQKKQEEAQKAAMPPRSTENPLMPSETDNGVFTSESRRMPATSEKFDQQTAAQAIADKKNEQLDEQAKNAEKEGKAPPGAPKDPQHPPTRR